MAKMVSFGLSVSEIENAIREIESYRDELAYRCQVFAERLAEIGVEIARVNVANLDAIYSGELLQSIRSEYAGTVKDGATWLIVTDCNYAAYVEFGTGVMGAGAPHPNTSISGWKYDINGHGDMGWFYYKDGDWHWTKGMKSRPFMYNTSVELNQRIELIAREVFHGA